MKKNNKNTLKTCEDFSADMKILGNFLQSRKDVPIDEIPEVFQEDFWNFTRGYTMYKNEKGQICVYAWDFYDWWQKIRNKGFDYDILDLTMQKKGYLS